MYDGKNTYCAFVVQPCHFRSASELCATTIARLDAALAEVERERRIFAPVIILTGDVAFGIVGPTLAELMARYLRDRGYQGPVLTAGGGTGTFTEPRLVVELVRESEQRFPGLREIIVVASGWLPFAALPFWEREAAKYGLGLDYRPVPDSDTRRWRTRLFYRAYGLLLRGALQSGIWPWLEPRLYRLLYQSRYKTGFRVNACR